MSIRKLIYLTWVIPALLCAEITELPLSLDKPVQIKVHPDVITAIIWPVDCDNGIGVGFESYDVLASLPQDEQNYDYDFVVRWDSPRKLSLRMASTEIPYRNFNVWSGDDLFVIETVPVENAADAYTKVSLYVPAVVKDNETGKVEEAEIERFTLEPPKPEMNLVRSDKPLAPKYNKRLDAKQLVGVLHLTQLASTFDEKGLAVLKDQRPNFKFATNDWEQVNYPDYGLNLYLVVRDSIADATGFFGTITNTSDKALSVDKLSYFVRVGDQIHKAVVAESSSTVAPNSAIPFWFVTYRTGDHRTNFSVNADFKVGVNCEG